MRSYEREVVRVNPYDAQVRVIGVVSSYLLQDLQELIAILEVTHTEKSPHSDIYKLHNQQTQCFRSADLDLLLQRRQLCVSHPCHPPVKDTE